MSTNSAIFIEKDGKIKGIYCHWDGNLEGVGRTLLEHYQNEDKVLRLIELGNISGLGSELGEKHDFNSNEHTDWTHAYHRDRGDNWEQSKPFEAMTYIEAKEFFKEACCSYFYIFRNGLWFVDFTDKNKSGPVLLSEALEEIS